jgi:lipoxygenase homology domain-containing protein 1
MNIRCLSVAATTLAAGLALGAIAPAAAAAQPAAAQSAVSYTVEVKTGDVSGAGTDADVYIRLLGSRGTTTYMELDKEGDDRERNQLDRYPPFYLSDLGTLTQVRISFFPAGDSSDWYLDYVAVDPSNGPKVIFPCYCWFTKEENKHLNPA